MTQITDEILDKAEEIKDKILSGECDNYMQRSFSKYYKNECPIEKTSDKELERVIEQYEDKPFAVVGDCDVRNTYLPSIPGFEDLYQMIGNCSPSGVFLVPPNGYCGWHTNSTDRGPRLYLVWSEEEGKSWFKRKDSEGKIWTKYEKQGWNINKFNAPDWHCLGSHTNRVSFGFNLYE